MDATVCDSRSLVAFAVTAATMAALCLTGCANEIDSSSPSFTGTPGATSQDEALAYPGFLCSAQEARWVEIQGKNFDPVPVGTMSKDGEPSINWPEVQLTRTAGIDGEPVTGGISVRIQATGKLERTVDEKPTPSADTGLRPNPSPEDPSDAGGDAGDASMTGDATTAGDADETGTEDTGEPDTGTADEDTGTVDTGEPDTGTVDTGEPDTGTVDTGTPSSDRDPKNVIWLDQTTLRFKVTPSMHLKPGMYDIKVTSARVDGDGAQLANSKSDTAERAFGILPPPKVDRVADDQPVCLAQGEKQITLRGNYFLKRDDRRSTVRIGEQSYELDAIDDCMTPEGPFGPYEVCKQMTVTVPEEAYPASAPDVHVSNFGPADCHNRPERDDTQLYVVDPPVVSEIRPDPICSAQNDYDGITITGQNFLGVRSGAGATMPTVEIGDYTAENVRLQDCSSEPGQFGCSTIKADIEAGAVGGDSDTAISTHRVSIANPSAVQCSVEHTTELTSIAPPTVDDVTPGAFVGTQSPTGVVLEGKRFAIVDGLRPTVTVTGGEEMNDYHPTAIEDCRSVEGPGRRSVEVCETLEFQIPADDFPIADDEETRSLQFQVRNPHPVACSLPEDATAELTVVKPPTLSGVETEPVCTNDQSKSVVLTGTNFVTVDGTGPRVGVGMQSFRATGVESSCEAVDQVGSADIQSCNQIRVELSEGALRSADHPVTVYNPDRIGGHTTETDVSLTAIDRPRISHLEPELTCLADGERTLTVHGQNFLRVVPEDMEDPVDLPTIDFAQTSATVTDRSVPDPMENCEPLAVPGTEATYQICEVLEVTVESDGVTGLSEATVTNPAPADCASAEPVDLAISPTPTVASAEVSPQSSCDESGFRRIVVSGSKFLRANGTLPSVTIGSETYQPLEAGDCSPVSGVDREQYDYCEELVVYGDTADIQGRHDVTVTNPSPSSCASGSKQFDVTANCP